MTSHDVDMMGFVCENAYATDLVLQADGKTRQLTENVLKEKSVNLLKLSSLHESAYKIKSPIIEEFPQTVWDVETGDALKFVSFIKLLKKHNIFWVSSATPNGILYYMGFADNGQRTLFSIVTSCLSYQFHNFNESDFCDMMRYRFSHGLAIYSLYRNWMTDATPTGGWILRAFPLPQIDDGIWV